VYMSRMRPEAVTFQPQECSILESPAFVLSSLLLVFASRLCFSSLLLVFASRLCFSSLLLVFASRCHPEPIRAQRGWVKDLLFLFRAP